MKYDPDNLRLDEKVLKDFIEYAEEFKKCTEYQNMPMDERDFFNEEIGSFKYALEIIQEGIKRNLRN
jgi:hypothetical protein